MHVLIALAPDLAIIVIGILAGPFLSARSWQLIDQICFYVLYPALLFVAASQRHIQPESLLLFGSLGCSVVTAGFLLALIVKRFDDRRDSVELSGLMQNAWRFNTALGFMAVGAFGQHAQVASAILAVVVGIAIPLANLYAIVLLTRKQQISTQAIVREIALNPFLVASVAGVLVALTGTRLPAYPNALLGLLADIALPVVLLSLGAALRNATFWPPERFALALHCIKLFALPALVFGITKITGLSGTVPATLLVFAALPTASGAHVLAARYGANRSKVAMAVMQSNALSLITLPFWIMISLYLL